jgi:tripartite-type tricarboxylate transporter receptor subunit TctC
MRLGDASMTERRSISRRRMLATALAAVCTDAASAQGAYPNRPIRLIIPFPAGGPTDVMGRLIAQAISVTLGQQVFVDNRPGAGATLAGKAAATADPDGYTLLMSSAATLAIGPALYKGVEYDPKSFVPVALVAGVPYLMIAGAKAPVKSVAGVIAYAKANPGKLNLGVPNGAPPHLLAAWFRSLTATDIVIVPYKGASNEITDIIGGHVDLGIEPTSVVLSHLGDGSVRAFATTTKERLPELPDVPTMIECGVPGYVASSWTGIVAPAGTPQPIVETLSAAVNANLASAEMKAKLKTLGAAGLPGTPAEFAAFLSVELPKWTEMAKLSGITGD